jgi:diaminohydroxyphosphoribosylaminopyrimidine deaminase/5-amino-6-(5-phosphoribosylamino)uracil reductase
MSSAFAHLLHDASHDPSGHMERALAEAVKGVGRTAPNPPVGAVVVRDDVVLGAGFHARAGERHGEIVALDDAKARGHDVRGATLFVTLEPCVHHGRTPPCTDRVLAEGIARVVVGAVDPNPRVHEKGIAMLRNAGVAVDLATGNEADRCRALIAPFARALVDRTPYVVLKTATSLDGRVACGNGASRWITGDASRALVHRLRDHVDAVLVGAGTVRADDPALTVRDLSPAGPGGSRATRNPLRVVVDSALRTPPSARVYEDKTGAGEPAPVVIHAPSADAGRASAFDRAGVRRLVVDVNESGHVDLAAAVQALVPLGVLSVLVEAGPSLATPLVQQRVIDELWWFQAPMVLGADGIAAFGPLGLTAPGDAPRLRAVHRAITGDDALTVLLPA